jgi:cytoskeletal protein CcmA (bactofilin family)
MHRLWPAALLLVFSVSPVGATVLRSGQNVVIGAGEVIDDDLVAAGTTITVAGAVHGDVIVAGQTVEISGPVEGSVFAVGQRVTVSGDTVGSVRAAGGNVSISGRVGRNADLAGQTLDVQRTARIGKDLHAAGNGVALAGRVDRGAWVAATTARVTGAVGQTLWFEGHQAELASGAVVGGDLIARSDVRPQLASGATVRGQVRYTKTAPRRHVRKWPLTVATAFLLFAMVYAFGALGLAVLPRVFAGAGYAMYSRPWWSLLLGVIALFVTPAVAAVVMFTIVGLPIALFILFVWGFAILLSGAPVGIFIGDWLLSRPVHRRASPYLALLVGLLVLTIFGLIPFLGALIKLATVLFGLGVFSRAVKGWLVESRRPVSAA